MRVTNNGMMSSYNSTLSRLSANVQKSLNQVSGQKFQKGSEDPLSAMRTRALYREMQKNEINLDSAKSAYLKVDGAHNILLGISTNVNSAYNTVMTSLDGAINDEEVRSTLATQLRTLQEGIVSSLNQQYGNSYYFGGTGDEAPFAIDSVTGELTYRGKSLDSQATDPDFQAWMQEAINVDIGSGVTYNIAISGLNFVGDLGVDADGYSNNIVTLLGQIAGELEATTFDDAKVSDMMKKLQSIDTKMNAQRTKLDASADYLDKAADRLTDANALIDERLADVAYYDTDLAITEYYNHYYTQYVTMSLMSNVLTTSFMDFLS